MKGMLIRIVTISASLHQDSEKEEVVPQQHHEYWPTCPRELALLGRTSGGHRNYYLSDFLSFLQVHSPQISAAAVLVGTLL